MLEQTRVIGIRFSPSTKNFYPPELDYGGSLPPDCVSVSGEVFTEIINPPEGMSRGVDERGYPILVRSPVYVPTWGEEVASREAKRKELLAEVDSISPVKWYGLSATSQKETSDYRNQLVDFNVEAAKLVWPTKPKGVFGDTDTKG